MFTNTESRRNFPETFTVWGLLKHEPRIRLNLSRIYHKQIRCDGIERREGISPNSWIIWSKTCQLCNFTTAQHASRYPLPSSIKAGWAKNIALKVLNPTTHVLKYIELLNWHFAVARLLSRKISNRTRPDISHALYLVTCHLTRGYRFQTSDNIDQNVFSTLLKWCAQPTWALISPQLFFLFSAHPIGFQETRKKVELQTFLERTSSRRMGQKKRSHFLQFVSRSSGIPISRLFLFLWQPRHISNAHAS